jgi:hypothetical protein
VLTFADRGCRVVSATNPHGRKSRFSRPKPLLSHSSSLDPVPDPLLLWICSQELWPLDHRGSPETACKKKKLGKQKGRERERKGEVLRDTIFGGSKKLYFRFWRFAGSARQRVWSEFILYYVGRATLEWNLNITLGGPYLGEISMSPVGGCMWSTQCSVEFGYQLSICSRIEETHGKTWSSCPVPDTNLLPTSSPALNTRTKHCCCFIWKKNVYIFLSTVFLCAYFGWAANSNRQEGDLVSLVDTTWIA